MKLSHGITIRLFLAMYQSVFFSTQGSSGEDLMGEIK